MKFASFVEICNFCDSYIVVIELSCIKDSDHWIELDRYVIIWIRCTTIRFYNIK